MFIYSNPLVVTEFAYSCKGKEVSGNNFCFQLVKGWLTHIVWTHHVRSMELNHPHLLFFYSICKEEVSFGQVFFPVNCYSVKHLCELQFYPLRVKGQSLYIPLILLIFTSFYHLLHPSHTLHSVIYFLPGVATEPCKKYKKIKMER